MTRPDDIPQRVWDEAQSVMMESRLFMIATDDFDEHSSIIARAIIAAEQREREACAQIADEYDGDGLVGGYDMHLGDAHLTMREIATAIRNRKETP